VTLTAEPGRRPDAPPLLLETAPDRLHLAAPPAPRQQSGSALLPPWRRGLTAGTATLLGAALMVVGLILDRTAGNGLGTACATALLATCVAVPLLVRRPLSVTPLALPPLLWAGAAAAVAQSSGQNAGRRELALDVATLLTITAPLLFGAVLLTVALLVGRLTVRLARRVARRRAGSGDAGRPHVAT
jgi:hypothetical protein